MARIRRPPGCYLNLGAERFVLFVLVVVSIYVISVKIQLLPDETSDEDLNTRRVITASKGNHTLIQTRRETPEKVVGSVLRSSGPLPGNLVYVAVLSAPHNFAKRAAVRKAWLSRMNEDYNATQEMLAQFVIGHEPSGRKGRGRPSRSQREVEGKLAEEQRLHNDIVRIALPELYQNLPDKTLQLLGLGVDKQYCFVLKLDDDRKLLPKVARKFALSHDPKQLVYGGDYIFNSPSFNSQYGADGEFARYFSGPSYIISWQLAWQVTKWHGGNSASYLRYGSSSEDVDMGKWVNHELRTAAGTVKVIYKEVTMSSSIHTPPEPVDVARAMLRLVHEDHLCVNSKDGNIMNAPLLLWKCEGKINERYYLYDGTMRTKASPEMCWVFGTKSQSTFKLGECDDDTDLPQFELTNTTIRLKSTELCLGYSEENFKGDGTVLRLSKCGSKGHVQEFQLQKFGKPSTPEASTGTV